MNICSLNIQGLNKHSDNPLFKEYCERFEIIALYETWQKSANEFKHFIHGYTCFESMRTRGRTMLRGSGGVSVFVKDWLVRSTGVTRIFSHFNECVVLLFNANTFHRNEDLIMFFTYVAPEKSPIYTDEENGIEILNDKISEIVSQYPEAELFVAGDLNARIADMQDFIPFDDLDFVYGETDYPSDSFAINRQSKDDTSNQFGMALIDLCCTHCMHVLNGRMFDDLQGEITCIANDGSSVVDYILASTSLFASISHFQVGNEDFSDHFPLHCRLEISYENNDFSQTELNVNGTAWVKYKWKDKCKNQFMQTFSTLFLRFNEKLAESDESNLHFLPEFIQIYKKAGKCMQTNRKPFKRTTCSKQPPWRDDECQRAKSNKTPLLRKYRRTNGRMELHNYKAAKARFKNICRSKRLLFEKNKRAELARASRNPREYWQLIKQNFNKTNDAESQITPENWSAYFENLLNAVTVIENDTLLQNITQENDCNDLDRPISRDEIVSCIKSMNTNKSPGPDGICMEMFKETLNEILPFLHNLFNELYDKGELPPGWCENIICPIHKSGSKMDPGNFRGVSLINSISKIFTGILTNRLQKWSEENTVLDESQAGFRKNYSTIDNIFSLHAIIQKYLCRPRGRFYCFFFFFYRFQSCVRQYSA